MKLKLAVLPGDGIGPEIMEQGLAVTEAICKKFGHELSYKYAICGADAIDKVGDPFPEETFQTCMDADAVLFASVGDPKFDNNPSAKVRPEQGLLVINFSRSKSVYDLTTRRYIRDVEGDDPLAVEKYLDPDGEPYRNMVDHIRRALGLTSLAFQRLDDLVAAIGLPKEKLCTYCWTGRDVSDTCTHACATCPHKCGK